MAVATARPVQALRQRRESARPGLLTRVSTRATTADAMEANTAAPSEPVPNVITPGYILKKFAGNQPSLILHLHPTHFRFDQQDGNFGYNSEMRFILEHLKNKTVPHEMLEELFSSGVKFYDGCLIVEVHNHRTGADPNAANATNQVGGTSQKPYSVHNWNEHITPSPYVPFPEQRMKSSPSSKANEKQPMPAPDQPASAMQKKGPKSPKVMTTVLFPTPLSLQEEMNMLARTPYTERLPKRLANGQTSKDGATPTAHPPTPLTSVPPTPLTAKGPSKQPQMILTEENAHEWEAEIINRTAPPLQLFPAKDFAESQAIIESLSHPLHSAKPPAPKARKRTTAELAADEAQAASEERLMLGFDERHQTLLAGSAAGGTSEVGGRAGGAGSFEPTFKRFKMLESVRMQHAEKDRAKKAEEAHRQHLKRQQQQQDADALKKREQQTMQAERERAMMQRQHQQQQQQQENLARQQQMQQAQQQAAAQQAHQQAQQQVNMSTPVTTHPQQVNMSMPAVTHPQLHQVSQASQMSPVIRQQTPHSASPTLNGTPIMATAPTSAPMTTSASNQGAGSPARPPSAMQHHQSVGMIRQASQQHGSTHGTPQVQNTPSMQTAVPVTRHMTPTSRVNQGSPIPGQMQNGTPLMMPTPTPGHQLTPEQQQQIINQRQRMLAQAQQAQAMGAQMSPQQMQLLNMYTQQQRAMAARQNQMGTPTPQGGMPHPNMGNQMQVNRSQMGMAGVGMSPQGNMNMMGGMANQGMPADLQAKLAQHKSQVEGRYFREMQQRQQQFLQNFGGMAPNPERMQAFKQAENQKQAHVQQMINVQLGQIRQQYMQQMQNGGMNMGQQVQQGMPNGQPQGQPGMQQGQQQPNNPAQQQYMMQLRQQREQMMARQRQAAMQQMGAQQGGMGAQMNGMGGMPNGGMAMGGGVMPQGMNGMPNMAGMNPQQMQLLQQQMMQNRQNQMMGQGGMQGGMSGGGMM